MNVEKGSPVCRECGMHYEVSKYQGLCSSECFVMNTVKAPKPYILKQSDGEPVATPTKPVNPNARKCNRCGKEYVGVGSFWVGFCSDKCKKNLPINIEPSIKESLVALFDAVFDSQQILLDRQSIIIERLDGIEKILNETLFTKAELLDKVVSSQREFYATHPELDPRHAEVRVTSDFGLSKELGLGLGVGLGLGLLKNMDRLEENKNILG